MPLRASKTGATVVTSTATTGLEVLAGLNTDGSTVSWMESNWPFFSWAIFLFGSGVLVARFPHRDQHWYGWLAVVMYSLHQSEEHAYDLRGWRYAFVPSLNLGPISKLFVEACSSATSNVACPLDPKITLYVNVTMIWVCFGGCMVAASFAPRRYLFSGSLNWGTALVNGFVGHILPAIGTSTYNPGLVQSIAMVPLSVYIIHKSGRPWLCVANGIIGHVALIVAIKVVYRFRTDEALTMISFMLLAGLVIPLVVSNYVSSFELSNKLKI